MARHRKGNPEAFPTEEIGQILKIAAGWNLPWTSCPTADAHYAGKGVKLGEPDRPIFWYKPEGAKTYRVIYADLSVKEAESAPKSPGRCDWRRCSRRQSEVEPDMGDAAEPAEKNRQKRSWRQATEVAAVSRPCVPAILFRPASAA